METNFGILHIATAKYAFFSSVHGTFSGVGHMVGLKTSFAKSNYYIFPTYSGI